ncbi:MAG TPA: ROK family transcriptional regulator [Longimicrobiaceae bacterium]|nr:ROK family transcriptional regulator [Longimicrobiaceae bacterium]
MRKIDVRDFNLATRTTSREINRRIVLNLVREHQPISRAELARRMDVGRGKVSLLVNELIEAGEILEGEFGESTRGRKPKMLYVRTHDRLVIAIDVRFSRTYVMLSDFAGHQIALETFDTVFDVGALVGEMAARVKRLVRAHGASGRIEGIGLVMPGMVDRSTGHVIHSPQLGWHDVNVRDPLAEATGLPVSIENAPIACALAQMWLGEASNDFVYVTVSDGVGVAIVVDGQVVRGRNDSSGEFGHIRLRPGGTECLCGKLGCWEAYTSNVATLSHYLGYDVPPREALHLLREQRISVAELIDRARTGDARALEALKRTGTELGTGLSMVLNALNPAQVFVGGEISSAWDLIWEDVQKEIRAGVLADVVARTPIIPEQTSAYPRLRGAAALVAAPIYAAPEVA